MTQQDLTDIRAQKIVALLAAGRYEESLQQLHELVAEIRSHAPAPPKEKLTSGELPINPRQEEIPEEHE